MRTAEMRNGLIQNGSRRDTWKSDEEALVNALVGAAWRNEMDQRSWLRSSMSVIWRKVALKNRRAH
ncbi:MAG: hypothetical protein FI707_07125 [SAR202 cluster bacterium]|jgi:hypothetical protein|nr:hypothetical protein [SAR202 cluster bacterium]MDP6663432.1 hypothetical protein [SAR202 cluster bacterium]MDP6800089.1 hypothetical protein [SAR202 cluster bacterium]MQG58734.1 hypothetical protein [SAR202 cluster bacterium]MQG68548.1 hypothetical protein [SAR202 cluster bacterium]|tara:strand:- start:203 stop:400 length:198 start_codon:yes stop_codon:yes gene_type:complete